MTAFTLCVPYFENPLMLARQIACWNGYDAATRAAVSVIVVDDGSPRKAAEPVIRANPCALKISLFRIAQNIPWNQHGARNLAAKMAGKDAWLLMTDIDHMLEPPEARKVVKTTLDVTRHYLFDRVSLPERAPYKRHCNTFLATREAYWKAGGYDEDYCGTYGGDGPFLRALAKVAQERLIKATVVRVPREVLADASTTEWPRDGAMKEAYREIHKAKNKAGQPRPSEPLRFTWERQL